MRQLLKKWKTLDTYSFLNLAPISCWVSDGFGWIWLTLRKIGRLVMDYMKTFVTPLLVSSLFMPSIKGRIMRLTMSQVLGINLKINLAMQLIIVATLCCAYVFFSEKMTLPNSGPPRQKVIWAGVEITVSVSNAGLCSNRRFGAWTIQGFIGMLSRRYPRYCQHEVVEKILPGQLYPYGNLSPKADQVLII